MSGVKNLRAMFENAQAPPERGRSPGGASADGTAPRPLSTVRTSFVAVEKNGRVGLKRGESGDSAISRRKFSGETEGDTSASTTATQESVATLSTKLGSEHTRGTSPATDSARSPSVISRTHTSPTPAPPTLSINSKPIPQNGSVHQPPASDQKIESPIVRQPDPPKPQASGDGDKTVDAETTRQVTVRKDQDGHAKPGSSSQAGRTEVASPIRGPTNVPKTSRSVGSGLNGTAKADKAAPKVTEQSRPKALAVSTTASKPLKSPVVKSPITPVAAGRSSTPAKSSLSKAVGTPQKTMTPSKNTPRLRTQQISTPPTSGTKPRSPTRPQKLPAGLSAPTAASAAKASPPRQTASRPSAASSTAASQSRSISRVSAATSSTTASRVLRRQASSIAGSRSSLGAAPKKAAVDHPPTKTEAKVDDSFLARITRPTQASIHRAQEASISPPHAKAAPTVKRRIVSAARKPTPGGEASKQDVKHAPTGGASSEPQNAVEGPSPTAVEAESKSSSVPMTPSQASEAVESPVDTVSETPAASEVVHDATATEMVNKAAPPTAAAAPADAPAEPAIEEADAAVASEQEVMAADE